MHRRKASLLQPPTKTMNTYQQLRRKSLNGFRQKIIINSNVFSDRINQTVLSNQDQNSGAAIGQYKEARELSRPSLASKLQEKSQRKRRSSQLNPTSDEETKKNRYQMPIIQFKTKMSHKPSTILRIKKNIDLDLIKRSEDFKSRFTYPQLLTMTRDLLFCLNPPNWSESQHIILIFTMNKKFEWHSFTKLKQQPNFNWMVLFQYLLLKIKSIRGQLDNLPVCLLLNQQLQPISSFFWNIVPIQGKNQNTILQKIAEIVIKELENDLAGHNMQEKFLIYYNSSGCMSYIGFPFFHPLLQAILQLQKKKKSIIKFDRLPQEKFYLAKSLNIYNLKKSQLENGKNQKSIHFLQICKQKLAGVKKLKIL